MLQETLICKNLYQLTGKESGIIIIDKTDEIIVCNWLTIDKGIPQYIPGTNEIIGDENEVKLIDYSIIDRRDIINLIDGKKVIYDVNDDLKGNLKYTKGAIMYELKGGYVVICPFDWH